MDDETTKRPVTQLPLHAAATLGRIEAALGLTGASLNEAESRVLALRRERDAAVEALDDLRADAGHIISDLHRANQLGPCGEVRQVAIERAIAALRAAVLGGV